MKQSARLILNVIKPIQRQPIKIEDIAKRAFMTARTANGYLRSLEKNKFLTVDRSERPHAYEITAEGHVALQFEEYRDPQPRLRRLAGLAE